jgi:hypothetical protein
LDNRTNYIYKLSPAMRNTGFQIMSSQHPTKLHDRDRPSNHIHPWHMKVPVYIMAMIAITTASVPGDSQPPVGTLTAGSNIVITGERPELEWSVRLPSKDVEDIVRIDKNNNVSTKKKVRVDVYMIGTGITSDYGQTQHETRTEINLGSGFESVFTGKGRDVRPSQVLISRVLEAGTKITFRAFFQDWIYNTSPEVVILLDDDKLPKELGRDGSEQFHNYLNVLVMDGKMDMGPSDLIYCAELTHTDKKSYGYDLQDLVVLLRFTEME